MKLKKHGKSGALILKDKVTFCYYQNGQELKQSIKYSDVVSALGLGNFNKQEGVEFLRNTNRFDLTLAIIPQIADVNRTVIELLIMTIFANFASTMIVIAAIAVVGYLVALLLKVRMRYVAVFNMGVYSLTLSIILQMIYNIINIFWEFRIPLFDVMYIGVAFIYLITALFITRIDLMKMQEEISKAKQIQKQVRKEKEEEEKEKEEKKPEPKEKKKDKKEKKEEEKGERQGGGEPEGSNV